jgi:hypothetical protein
MHRHPPSFLAADPFFRPPSSGAVRQDHATILPPDLRAWQTNLFALSEQEFWGSASCGAIRGVRMHEEASCNVLQKCSNRMPAPGPGHCSDATSPATPPPCAAWLMPSIF